MARLLCYLRFAYPIYLLLGSRMAISTKQIEGSDAVANSADMKGGNEAACMGWKAGWCKWGLGFIDRGRES